MGPNFVLRRRTAPIGPIWITELGMFYAATEPAWRPRHRRRGSTLPGRVRLQLPTRRHEAVAPELGDEAIHCSSAAAAGVEGFRLDDLRHFMATQMLAAGV